MVKSTVERRAHRRVRKSFDLHGAPPDGATTARMVASDLSAGGLYCTSTRDFPEMTRLSVRLMLPRNGRDADDPVPVDVDAVVVRRDEVDSPTGNLRYALALLFTGLTAEQRAIIHRCIDSR